MMREIESVSSPIDVLSFVIGADIELLSFFKARPVQIKKYRSEYSIGKLKLEIEWRVE